MQWFTGGQLNACYNACDRHDPSKTAIIWEGNEPTDIKAITYGEMTKRVSQYANVLKSVGVVKGDRIVIYMPMVAETAYAMLACARIGRSEQSTAWSSLDSAQSRWRLASTMQSVR